MKRVFTLKSTVLMLSFVAAIFALCPAVAHADAHGDAEEATETETETETVENATGEGIIQLESVVTLGSRARPRSVLDSAVPIDVLSSEEFIKQGGADLNDLLRNVVPSYNINTQPISDAATVVRPANLRGLAPDHTLVLINGKRRHRSSVIYWGGNGLAAGAQGPDLSSIPAIALKQVEVLRDGASAQYGSDAIAGVMNFELKDNYEGFSLETKVGGFQEGDGELYTIAANIGLGTEEAWSSLSGEFGYSGSTLRSLQRLDAERLIYVGNTNVNNPAQLWGQPEVKDDLKLFANYGVTLTDSVKFYGHASYGSRRGEGGFFFRNPNTRGGVFSGDGGKTLLIGNLSGTGEVPTVAITDDVPDAVALKQVFDDDNLFSFQEVFPGGFTPRFGADVQEQSAVFGLRGTLIEKLGWDVSASYGQHEADFFIYNTVNASLGPDTPTSFDPGAYIQAEINLNVDATYPISEQVSLAAGAEYRVEEFEIVRGQIESYVIGPLAEQGFSAASNGFPGFSDIAAGSWNRSNVAGYVETELRPMDDWIIGAALRGEDFSDFGTTLNYKLATNYGVTDALKVRGSFSTGFRAPTPGQQNAFNVSTQFNVALNDLLNNGTIPSTNKAAELKGGQPLKPEKSINITAGIIFSLADVNITVDYFNIGVTDRLTLSQNFKLSDAEKEQLLTAGITSAKNLQQFRFFINDFDTRTQGVDVVFTKPIGNGDVSFAYNITDTEITKHNPETLDPTRMRLLQDGVPQSRWTASGRQALNETWGLLGRVSYYSGWYEGELVEHTFSGEIVCDVEAQYAFPDGRTAMTFGIQNLLDNYPDKVLHPEKYGNPYGEHSPFGFGGRFWYVKMGYSF